MTTTTCDGDVKIRREEKDAVMDLLKSYNIKDRDVYYMEDGESGYIEFSCDDFSKKDAEHFFEDAKYFLLDYSFYFEENKGVNCYRITKKYGYEAQHRFYHSDAICDLVKAGYPEDEAEKIFEELTRRMRKI